MISPVIQLLLGTTGQLIDQPTVLFVSCLSGLCLGREAIEHYIDSVVLASFPVLDYDREAADWHARDFYSRSPARNPVGPAGGRRRASRGGSWRHAVTISRVAARSKLDPSFRYTDYGFRVARDV